MYTLENPLFFVSKLLYSTKSPFKVNQFSAVTTIKLSANTVMNTVHRNRNVLISFQFS